ncbi:MAG: HD domain-containing protein [Candidatus Cloacimonetes bacterium]|nr:HD domain-containing protein [Candidatus Cloacimonadota bacterium]
MTTHIFIKDLHEQVGKDLTDFYLVAEKELREGKQGYYLRLKLQDKSGTISANLWTNAEKESQNFDEGDVIKIKAGIVSYKGQTQVSIQKLRFADHSEYDIEDYLVRSKKDPDHLSSELFGFIDSLENSYLKKLLKSIYDDKAFYSKFINAPAAKSWHHNFLNGLLEHTVSVAQLCDFLCTQYPVDRDLLITGALLHDVSKVVEYTSKLNIEFSDIGRLVGHLSLADELVCSKAAQIDSFPPELLMHVRHLILAHHGEYEKASVRLPQTLEALVLHLADNLDAQTTGVMQLIESAPPDARWTEFDKLNNRYYLIYRPIS